MLNIVCVNWRNYQGRGVEYVNILQDMVRRNIPPGTEGRFFCFTDDIDNTSYDEGIILRKLPDGLEGWYNKLYLLRDGLFETDERIIFFDLDVIVTGDLTDLVKYGGDFGILEDVFTKRYNSSIMAWKANTPAATVIWQAYEEKNRPTGIDGGDQQFLWDNSPALDNLSQLFPRRFVSYRTHALFNIPNNAKVVLFHGNPKPHEITAGWPLDFWKKGGASLYDWSVVGNTGDNTIVNNIKSAIAAGYEFIKPHPAHEYHAVICGGGPSITENIEEIKQRKALGQVIVALNGALKWLTNHGVEADYHILLDARLENIDFVPPDGICTKTALLYSAQCHPEVLKNAHNPICWIPYADGLPQLLGEFEAAYIGGGSSVGLKAIPLLWVLGYRTMHLYGYDSSYREAEHHAYDQPLNAKENIITVEVAGQKFLAAPWMASQAMEFRDLMAHFVNKEGCTITVHGDGLLPFVASRMNEKIPPGSIEQLDGIWWPAEDTQAKIFIPGELHNSLPQILSHVKNFGTCVQAGGNVGLWPIELAKHFDQVLTFEPDPVNFKCLTLNLEAADEALRNKISASQTGLAGTCGTTGIVRDPENCGAHYLSGEGEIDIITIDSMQLEGCDLIQLDIEGAEIFALQGARFTIEKFHPVIVTEEKDHGKRLQVDKDAISSYLALHGYEIAGKVARDVIYTFNPHQ